MGTITCEPTAMVELAPPQLRPLPPPPLPRNAAAAAAARRARRAAAAVGDVWVVGDDEDAGDISNVLDTRRVLACATNARSRSLLPGEVPTPLPLPVPAPMPGPLRAEKCGGGVRIDDATASFFCLEDAVCIANDGVPLLSDTVEFPAPIFVLLATGMGAWRAIGL